jgi:outer membrane protein assembly factor BamB
MAGFDPQAQSWNPWENVLTRSNVSGLQVAWVDSTTSESNDTTGLFEAPSVVDGYVYTTIDYNDSFAQAYLVKLDAATGAIVWKTKYPGDDLGAVVYNGFDYWVGSGVILVTNDSTGAVVANISGGCGQEIVVGNALYSCGTRNGVPAEYNLDTNQMIWSSLPAGDSASSGFAYDDGMLFLAVTVNDGATSEVALDASDGSLVWSTAMPDQVQQAPVVVAGDVIFADTGGTTYALDENDGSQNWATADVPGGGHTPPAAASGAVFQFGDPGVTALNATTGSVLWTDPAVQGDRAFSDAIANGVLYVANAGLTALDTNTGATLYSDQTYLNAGIAVANGNVYTGTFHGGLDLLDYSTS